ncbi:hypothetical protein KFK09_010375 [Dendrobium nobile]|uniref:SART-1 family protein DOT2 n=1 Tax=Dendrobium nobile TaxID=94219 RepID=A0A8T3B9T4_DENNO|nr:hypothetical protein KFK09_010375 [Dendrobium nobile]
MSEEEAVRSREQQGEEQIGGNQRVYDHDEMEIDIETEKSREMRKPDTKQGKKERQEEKDYGGKDKERSKQREKEDISGRNTDKHGSRERLGINRGKRKEDQEDYGKKMEELELDKEKVRDKIRERDYDQIMHREDRENERAKYKGKEHEKGKDIDHNKEKSIDRECELGRGHGKDRGREGKFKEKERDRDKDIGRSRERSIDREHDQSRDHLKDRSREGEKEKEVERDRGFHREREHKKERERLHDYHKDRGKNCESDKDKEYDKSKIRDRDHDKDIGKEFERDRVREKDRVRGKDKEKEKDKDRYRSKDREREKLKDREKEIVSEKLGERGKLEKDKAKKKNREMEVDMTVDQDRSKRRDEQRDVIIDKEVEVEENLLAKKMVEIHEIGDASNKISLDDPSVKAVGSQTSSELKERIKKLKEERINGNSESVLTRKELLEEDSGILMWVSRSRKLEEKRNAEKEKAIALSRMLDEQDKILEEAEDEEPAEDGCKDLAGVKVLHGLDKVMEGGAVVLTLKDQNILADGDINEEVDMLESVEIGEQKRRNEAYRAAKGKTGKYDDKFTEDQVSRKTILSQYDDPVDDEEVTLDESGRFTGEAEKQLAELRKRIEGNSLKKDYEDLSSSVKIQSDYFTTDEMLQFKKPKKKKSLRKKERLDLDALEAEARAAGLGLGDLGTRGDMKRLSTREEEEKSMAEARSNAYQAALAKAEEASKFLREGQTLTSKPTDNDNLVFGEDFEDLQKSLEQARKLALKKQDEVASSGPQAVALLATAHKELDVAQDSAGGDIQENKVVITEMEEFVLGLQINEETNNLESEDVFKDEEDVPMSIDQETKTEIGGWIEAKEIEMNELSISGENVNITPDEIIHETAVGKGLAGALKLLKDRGTLKDSIDWGGRNMDKKKSKLAGIYTNDGSKEIRIERTDEFGRIMTPKEAFRMLSHKFHGKGPGKTKIEKRMKQYLEDLKTKQMKASDTPLLAMEKMREAQARLKSPYLVLSGHVKPGQTSDPRSGFATVEKDNPGSLTPMLGDKKVEHFLGIRSKPDSDMGPPPPKKPKI